ncbi:MAG: Spy/CpxP family protein refolding chaperone [Desulfurivibrionaceae bacterium]
MKKTALIATTFFFFACLTANAQMGHMGKSHSCPKHGKKQNCMKHDGMGSMHQGMMAAKSMKKSMMIVKMLPGMQEHLSLSQEQTNKLLDLQTSFKKQKVDYKAELTKETTKLQSLLDDEAPVDKVKSQLKACSDLKINMHSAAYETGKKMKDVLTDEQKKDLEDIIKEHTKMARGTDRPE